MTSDKDATYDAIMAAHELGSDDYNPLIKDEPTGGCGYSWDHTLTLHWEQDGMRCYTCDECGAEIVEDIE